MATALNPGEVTGPVKFDVTGEAASIGARWKRWKKAFQYYLDGRGITQAKQARALLLHCAGMDVQDIFETLTDPGHPDGTTPDPHNVYEKAVRTLDAHFLPKLDTPYERHLFHRMRQEENETVDQYVARLRRQGQNCKFPDLDDCIRDQLVDGCRSLRLRRKLLEKGSALTLVYAQMIARTLEAVELQSANMGEAKPAKAEVNRVESKEKGQARPRGGWKRCYRCGKEGHFAKDGKCTQPSQKRRCYRCGREGHIASDEQCPAKKATCRKCKLVGHFDTMCKTKQKKGNTGTNRVNIVESEDEYAFTVGEKGEDNEGSVDITVDGVTLPKMLIDSGATCNIITKRMWNELKQRGIAGELKGTTKKLYPYGSKEPLACAGVFQARAKAADREVKADFVVVNGHDRGLLGRATAQQLGVLKLGPEAVNTVNTEADDIVQQYPECFNGLGKLKNFELKIHIDESVKPVAQATRRIPFGLRGKLEEKLDELVEKDVIETVEGPTPWVSPAVVIPKPSGEIRVCVDMRRANTAVIRERHPIPTIDEVLEKMNGSTVFSKLDLKWGFHQIELAEGSRGITTFSTHKGLFRYKRLMFGISCAPEIYQHVIQQVLAGCEGSENISDDIIVHGKGREDHDEKLKKVLCHLKERGLTLNRQKCEFCMPQLMFMGKVLSKRGVGPTETKIEAIREAREPENASEVRSFLGLVNFNGRFIPNLATTAEPLRRLTRKDVTFKWGKQEQAAFKQLKEDLTKAETLAYFDKDAPTQVIADAGPVGLGAVLVQDQGGEKRVVCYASRSLTEVERRYSQTEKEALALVWACERFHLYLYGIQFELVTDHKPLEAIYSPQSKPSARIERWVLRLQPYKFTVKYIPGPQNIADPLSRLTMKMKPEGKRNVAEEYIRFVAENAAPQAISIREIERKSEEDPELTEVRRCVLMNKWDDGPNAYKAVRNELTVLGKLVLRGTRIVMPRELRNQTIELAHEGHLGIVKTKVRLRSKVWWPGLDRDAELRCRTCHACQVVGLPTPPEPVKSTALPTSPWVDLAADLMGPLPSGEHLFVVVDYFSRYVEVKVMKTTTAQKIIAALDEIFARNGLPWSIKTDNGRQFIAQELTDYLKENDIEHRRSTPLWPQANGEVERQNRHLLKAMKIAKLEGRSLTEALNTYLMAYRTTAHSTTGVSPAQLLFGRQVRCKVPMLQEDHKIDLQVQDKDREMKQKVKDDADSRRGAKESNIQVGDSVLLQQQKRDKLTPQFEPEPYSVVGRHGSQIWIQSPAGVQYKRNVALTKKYQGESGNGSKQVEPPEDAPPVVSPETADVNGTETVTASAPSRAVPITPRRSARESVRPRHFDDFVMD